MRGDAAPWLLLLLSWSALCVATEEPPPLEFIEFLGEWIDDHGIPIDFEMFEDPPRARAPLQRERDARDQYNEPHE